MNKYIYINIYIFLFLKIIKKPCGPHLHSAKTNQSINRKARSALYWNSWGGKETMSKDLLLSSFPFAICPLVSWNSIQDNFEECVHISDVISISLIVFMACADSILQCFVEISSSPFNLPVEKAAKSSAGWPKHSSASQRIRANFQSMTSSSVLSTFYFAIVAWLYSSICVLFLSDSVPELYNIVFDKVYVIYIDVRDIAHM